MPTARGQNSRGKRPRESEGKEGKKNNSGIDKEKPRRPKYTNAQLAAMEEEHNFCLDLVSRDNRLQRLMSIKCQLEVRDIQKRISENRMSIQELSDEMDVSVISRERKDFRNTISDLQDSIRALITRRDLYEAKIDSTLEHVRANVKLYGVETLNEKLQANFDMDTYSMLQSDDELDIFSDADQLRSLAVELHSFVGLHKDRLKIEAVRKWKQVVAELSKDDLFMSEENSSSERMPASEGAEMGFSDTVIEGTVDKTNGGGDIVSVKVEEEEDSRDRLPTPPIRTRAAISDDHDKTKVTTGVVEQVVRELAEYQLKLDKVRAQLAHERLQGLVHLVVRLLRVDEQYERDRFIQNCLIVHPLLHSRLVLASENEEDNNDDEESAEGIFQKTIHGDSWTYMFRKLKSLTKTNMELKSAFLKQFVPFLEGEAISEDLSYASIRDPLVICLDVNQRYVPAFAVLPAPSFSTSFFFFKQWTKTIIPSPSARNSIITPQKQQQQQPHRFNDCYIITTEDGWFLDNNSLVPPTPRYTEEVMKQIREALGGGDDEEKLLWTGVNDEKWETCVDIWMLYKETPTEKIQRKVTINFKEMTEIYVTASGGTEITRLQWFVNNKKGDQK